jgi:hypothetical protein
MEYVPPDAFGEDYLYFYDAFLTDEVSDRQADRFWRLLGLQIVDDRDIQFTKTPEVLRA